MTNRLAVCLSFLLLFSVASHAAVSRVGGPATTNNDDSCDIALLPAATLLLPYFEVDIDAAPGLGETTLFTVTNTGSAPQVARVTLWTDFAYPVVAFNLYLTGYDIQSINLYDVIAGGKIAPGAEMGADTSPFGALSDAGNPLVSESSCEDLLTQLPESMIERMRSALTLGRIPAAGGQADCNTAGNVHDHAVGYATIDVVSSCSQTLPTDAAYFEKEILFDNVLMGDSQQVHGGQDSAQGNPMVHIRAIPEGGSIEARSMDPAKFRNFRRTFYSRLQPATVLRTHDARQPLPSIFGSRWISAGSAGFQTSYKIWREGRSDATATCGAHLQNVMPLVEIVRFDDEENPEVLIPDIVVLPPFDLSPKLPATSLGDVRDSSLYPPNSQFAISGWMYLNLNARDDEDATQNWVTVSMRVEGRFSTDFDAIALGNGCTLSVPESEALAIGSSPIGPARNRNP
jgi:hypothetical protein